jgi:hypothetical protein
MNKIHKYNKPCTYVLVDRNGHFSELTRAAGLNIIEAGLLQSTQLFHDTSCKDVLDVYCMQGGEVTFSFKRTATQEAFIACHKALCKHFKERLSVEAVNGLMQGLRWFHCVTIFFL